MLVQNFNSYRSWDIHKSQSIWWKKFHRGFEKNVCHYVKEVNIMSESSFFREGVYSLWRNTNWKMDSFWDWMRWHNLVWNCCSYGYISVFLLGILLVFILDEMAKLCIWNVRMVRTSSKILEKSFFYTHTTLWVSYWSK